MSTVKLLSSSGGSVEIAAPVTASNYVLTAPAVTANIITDSAGVLNIGSGQVYKDASGNVGIGTSSPSAKLDVVGNVQIKGGGYELFLNSDNTNYYYLQNTGATGSSNAKFEFVQGGVGTRLTLDASGNLLVGTTSQLNSLSKVGVAFDQTVNYGLILKNTNASNGGVYAYFTNSANGGAGYISQASATSVLYNTSSDYRLKENVQPMSGALDKISALKPVTYTWKVDGSADRGFIAHELQEIIPQAVSGKKDAVDGGGNIMPQGVDYGKITPEIVAAIQEQQAIIEQLKAEIAEIKNRYPDPNEEAQA